ncbi:MAG: DNA alkylation repair protein [Bacilli bacterium]|nr:DNA alkylation repair protein [Bacilli bacterium]
MTYKELEKYLEDNANKKFADFAKTVSNSEYLVFGVKNPVLRQIVKEHVKDEEMRLEDFKTGKYLEIDFIYFGLALSRCKNIDEQLELLKQNIKKAKSWAITDTAATFLKKLTFDKYWPFFLSLVKSPFTFDRRMAFVVGLKLAKDKNILNVTKYIKKDEEYMVMMAEAWLLATVAIYYPDEVYDYLKDCEDLTLKRKTISKTVDSFRINDSTKERFKGLR